MSNKPVPEEEFSGPRVDFAIVAGNVSEAVTVVVRGAPIRVRLFDDNARPSQSTTPATWTVHDEEGKMIERVVADRREALVHVWPHRRVGIQVDGVFVTMLEPES